MLNHILVPLDGSLLAECVLPHAITLAQVFDTTSHCCEW
jgi:nucleotide-binding universal stress UspA family protein